MQDKNKTLRNRFRTYIDNMTVHELISPTTPPLNPSDSVEYALDLLMENHVRHLPVVSDGRVLLGVVSEEQLLDAAIADIQILDLLGAEPVKIEANTHVFNATKVLIDHDLTTLPIVNDNGDYLGLVRKHDLFDRFARMLATQESGAIVSIEANERDVVLSQIIHLIEQNDGRVLSVSTEKRDEVEGTIGITIKVNVKDGTRIRHLLEHHGYKVESAFGEDDDPDEMLDRVQEFLRYLEA